MTRYVVPASVAFLQTCGHGPLFAASGNGHVDVVRVLLAAGANANLATVGARSSVCDAFVSARHRLESPAP